MSEVKVYIWNTGAQYTREGQPMAAYYNAELNFIYFLDEARGIGGWFTTAPGMREIYDTASLPGLTHYVHQRYLRNDYELGSPGDADWQMLAEARRYAPAEERAIMEFDR